MNFYTAQQVVFGRDFMNTLLAALATRPGAALIVSGKLRLSHDPSFSPTPDSDIATLATNEANYSGYTAGGLAATLSAVVDLSTQAQGVLIQGLYEATTATPFVPDNVTGWWLDDGTNVIAAERFAGNQMASFSVPGSFLALTAILPGQLTQATS